MRNANTFVMPGLDPGIHLLRKTFFEAGWIAGSSPAMTPPVNLFEDRYQYRSKWWARLRFAHPTIAQPRFPRGLIPSHFPAAEKRQPLEQMHVLFVFQQRAVQRRDQLARIAFPEHFRGHVLF